jgi:protein phosphatase
LQGNPRHPLRSLPPYLDPYKRYRPFDLTRPNDRQETETRVYDFHPQTPPYRLSDTAKIPALLPELAQPYLHPYCSANSALPPLHDAWANDRYAIVLLEDRSSLTPLLDGWRVNADKPLQHLYWMYQMNDLWMLLAEIACRPSLNALHNLRLDRDRIICLQRLYPEKEEKITLKHLGQTWNALFQGSRVTPDPAIAQTLAQVESGQIPSPDRLRVHLDGLLETFDSEDEEPTEWNFQEEEITVTAPIPSQVRLEAAGQTDIGRQRDRNEDTFWLWTRQDLRQTPSDRRQSARGIYVLCDGMGGHEGGEVASALAVDVLTERLLQDWGDGFPEEDEVRAAVAAANTAIYEFNQERQREGSGRMGTTLVVLLVDGDRAVVAHVGDSRLYAVTSRRGLQLLTVDHEVGQQAIARGIDPEMAYRRPEAYQLTQALGPRANVRPDVRFLSLEEDTLFLLASDGLSDRDLVELHWETHLKPYLSPSSNLDRANAELIDLANRENGRDNVTTILVRVTVAEG